MKRPIRCLAIAAAMLAGTAASASAATVAVDDDAKATPRNCDAAAPASPSVQAAVLAAGAGDTIVVCPGTYVEQVIIPADKDRLTLISAERRQAVIKAPPTSNATYNRAKPDLVRVEGASDVSILRFTITGPLADDQFCNELLNSAVRILDGGSATLVDNRITEARSANPALFGCQNGFGVAIGRSGEATTGSARLFANEIDRYQKGGIYVDGEGSELVARGNVIRGSGPTNAIGQNGVQISRGARADVRDNRVEDNVYGVRLPGGVFPPEIVPGQASGFILFELDGGVDLDRNLVRTNDTNIALYDVQRTRVKDNTVLDATFYDGLFADEDTAENRFQGNVARNNEEHDCHDDSVGGGTAGTANVWKDNEGVTETPPGLCDEGREKDDDRDDDDDGDDDDRGTSRR